MSKLFYSQELIKMLVDPSIVKTLTFPRDVNELIQQLSHNYVTYYDNVSTIRGWISDELCRAVSGSGSSKRQLYTDDDDIIRSFKRCIGINGINLAFLGGIFGLPGIGHIYVGKVKKGILILIGGLVIYIIMVFSSIALNTAELLSSVQTWVVIIVIFLGGYIALFVWQIFDAREFAKKFNKTVRATGKEPW